MDNPDLNGVGLIDNSIVPLSVEEISYCDLVNSKITEGDKLNCVLPSFNFQKPEHFAALSDVQRIDISTRVGSTKVLAIPFPTISDIEIIITTIDSVGTYNAVSFYGNITGASYRLDKNDLLGLQPVVLPVVLALGYKLEITVTRATTGSEDSIVLKGA